MISIEILNPNKLAKESQFSTDGTFLDLPDDFDLRFTKFLEELTDINKITKESALTFSVDYTELNDALFYEYRYGSKSSEYYDIRLIFGSETMVFNRLHFKNLSDPTRQYELKLSGGHWIELLDELKLSQLVLPNFLFNKANVEATWSDREALVVFPPADYGRQFIGGRLGLKDVRPVFNLRKLLDFCFCAIGYEYKNTFLESIKGRRIYGYLSGANWHSYENKNDEKRVELDVAADITVNTFQQLTTLNEISDPLDLWDNSAIQGMNSYYVPLNIYEPPLKIDLHFNFNVELSAPITGKTPYFIFAIVGYVLGSSASAIYDSWDLVGTVVDGTTRTVNYTGVISLEVEPNTYLSFWSGYGTFQDPPADQVYTDAKILTGSTISIRPDPKYLVDGDSIPLANLLSSDITGLDVLKGVTHYMNGKFESDLSKRVVNNFPPETVLIGGEEVEGFYLREKAAQDLTEFVQVNSKKLGIKETETARFYELKFAKTSDEYLKGLKLPISKGGRNIDLGVGANKTEEIKNPFFEPTILREKPLAEADPNIPDIFLPSISNNEDGNLSDFAGYRMLYHYGLVEELDDDGNPTRGFSWEGVQITAFGLLSMGGDVGITPGDNFRIGYGYFEEDAFNKFYSKFLNEKVTSSELEFLIFLDYLKYRNISFRLPVAIIYRGLPKLYQLIYLKDHSLLKNKITPVGFREIKKC